MKIETEHKRFVIDSGNMPPQWPWQTTAIIAVAIKLWSITGVWLGIVIAATILMWVFALLNKAAVTRINLVYVLRDMYNKGKERKATAAEQPVKKIPDRPQQS